jgi:hypothetical protein
MYISKEDGNKGKVNATIKCDVCSKIWTVRVLTAERNEKNNNGKHICHSCVAKQHPVLSKGMGFKGKKHSAETKKIQSDLKKGLREPKKHNRILVNRKPKSEYRPCGPVPRGQPLTRKCAYCKRVLPFEQFVRDKFQKYGRSYVCSKCPAIYSAIKERISKYLAKKRRSDPKYRFVTSVRKGIRHAFNQTGLVKRSKTFDFLGYSQEDLFKHLSKFLNEPCLMCNTVVITLDNLEIDHIIPISSARTEYDIWLLNQLNNLRLLCEDCNLKKGDRIELS